MPTFLLYLLIWLICLILADQAAKKFAAAHPDLTEALNQRGRRLTSRLNKLYGLIFVAILVCGLLMMLTAKSLKDNDFAFAIISYLLVAALCESLMVFMLGHFWKSLRRHPGLSDLYRAGLAALAAALVVMAVLYGPAIVRLDPGPPAAMLEAQFLIAGPVWVACGLAAVYYLATKNRGQDLRAAGPPWRAGQTALAAAVFLGLSLGVVLFATRPGLQPTPYDGRLAKRQVGRLSLELPEDWTFRSGTVRARLPGRPGRPGLENFEFSEALFRSEPDDALKEMDTEAAVRFGRVTRPLGRLAPEDWTDVSARLGRPARLAALTDHHSEPGRQRLCLVLQAQFKGGFLTLYPHLTTEPTGLRDRLDRPVPYSLAGPADDPAWAEKARSDYLEAVRVFLADYRWLGPDGDRSGPGFHTGLGLIVPGPVRPAGLRVEFEHGFDQRLTVMDGWSEFAPDRLFVRPDDFFTEARLLAAPSIIHYKIHQAALSFFPTPGDRALAGRRDRTAGGRHGLELVGGRHGLAPHYFDREIRFAWRGGRDCPETGLLLRIDDRRGDGRRLNFDREAGLWEAVLGSLRFENGLPPQ